MTTQPATRRRRRRCPRAPSSSCGWPPPAATPSVFPEPDAFDLDRENARRHLAFGRGIHYCLGASLGKLEAELAVAELARRWPRLALVEGQELSFHPNISFRGPQALWVVAGRRLVRSALVALRGAYCLIEGKRTRVARPFAVVLVVRATADCAGAVLAELSTVDC